MALQPAGAVAAPPPVFTAHNIQLDDGSWTMPPQQGVIPDNVAWFKRSLALMRLALPGEIEQSSLVDIGCLEGGFAVAFARAGFRRVVGIEVRSSNFAACRYVQQRLGSLRNLEFVHDNALNIERHGRFDAAFCCGLLYHLDRPFEYIRLLGQVVRRVVIINTSFAPVGPPSPQFNLSELTENEGLPGRWFPEHDTADPDLLETYRWASWSNRRSFWLTREALVHAIRVAGFDLVFEQFDCHVEDYDPDLLTMLQTGYPAALHRGVFVGIRS